MNSPLIFLLCLLVSAAAWPDRAREILAADDGWGASGSGTTGGVDAAAGQVWCVRNRRELLAALGDGQPSDDPKIVVVHGLIDANVDAVGQPLGCLDYQREGYTQASYLRAFDPRTHGRLPVSGPLEAARLASQQAQQARVRIGIGSNTTLIGAGRDSGLRGAALEIVGRDNVIVRNLNLVDTYDCFPQWSPEDGPDGNWNSQYDNLLVRDSRRIWIDHNRFADQHSADSRQPEYFGRPYQIHDGLLDLTHGSDRVTVSWNYFHDHDKGLLMGGSDSHTTDAGRLRISLHHNLFENLVQRAPRVRFGQVHVYNNLYRIPAEVDYEYSLGLGLGAQLLVENNVFVASRLLSPPQLLRVYGGERLLDRGNWLNGVAVDLRLAWNAAHEPDLYALGEPAAPALQLKPTASVEAAVTAGVGPIDWASACTR